MHQTNISYFRVFHFDVLYIGEKKENCSFKSLTKNLGALKCWKICTKANGHIEGKKTQYEYDEVNNKDMVLY